MQKQGRLLLKFIGWFYLFNAIIFLVLGSRYLVTILGSDTLFNTLLTDCVWYSKCLTLLFTLVNFFVYMILLAWLPAIVTFILALIYPRKQFVICSAIVLGSCSILALMSDIYVYGLYKFHINTTIIALIFSVDVYQVFDFSTIELLEIFLLVCAVVILETIISWWAYTRFMQQEYVRLRFYIITFWIYGAIFCYGMIINSIAHHNHLLLQHSNNLPLYNDLLAWSLPNKDASKIIDNLSEQHYTQALFANKKFYYPKQKLQCQASLLPNIIFIMVDALRADALQDMPHVRQFAAHHWQFMHHISGGNSTQAGLFSLFYSIPSSYWTAALKQGVRPAFITTLLKFNYKIHAFFSTEMRHPPLDKTIFLNIKDITANGAVADDLAAADIETSDRAIKLLNKPENKPFMLHLFYNAAHGHCRLQNFVQLYQPALQNCSRLLLNNNTDPLPLYNSYRNAVYFVDQEIARVLDVIQAKGYLQNSIVIITSDHGQEYNDNHQNYWGHAGNYTAVQTEVPLIIHWPGTTAQKFWHVTTSYDIVPTILQRIFHCKNSSQDYSIGKDLLDKTSPSFILSGSYANMGMITANNITTFHVSGDMSVTSLHADPLAIKPDRNLVGQALRLMRYYFLEPS